MGNIVNENYRRRYIRPQKVMIFRCSDSVFSTQDASLEKPPQGAIPRRPTGRARPRGGWTPVVLSTKPSGGRPGRRQHRGWPNGGAGKRRLGSAGTASPAAGRPARHGAGPSAATSRHQAGPSATSPPHHGAGPSTTGRPAWSRPPCHIVATWTAWVDGVGGRWGGPFRLPPALEAPTHTNAWPAQPPSPTPVPWPHAAGGATGLGSA